MDIKISFADRLYGLREEKKISQAELAEIIGVSRGSISFYENAERTADIETLVSVAKYFDVSVDYLLGRSPNKEAFQQPYVSAETTLSEYSQMKIQEEFNRCEKCLERFQAYYIQHRNRSELGLGSYLLSTIEAHISTYEALITYLEQSFELPSIVCKYFEMHNQTDFTDQIMHSLAYYTNEDTSPKEN